MDGLGLSNWLMGKIGFECYWMWAKYEYGCL